MLNTARPFDKRPGKCRDKCREKWPLKIKLLLSGDSWPIIGLINKCTGYKIDLTFLVRMAVACPTVNLWYFIPIYGSTIMEGCPLFDSLGATDDYKWAPALAVPTESKRARAHLFGQNVLWQSWCSLGAFMLVHYPCLCATSHLASRNSQLATRTIYTATVYYN